MRRNALRRRRLRVLAAAALLGSAIAIAVGSSSPAQPSLPSKLPVGPPAPKPPPDAVARGRVLYLAGCSSCHGLDANGIRGAGPSLHGVGPGPADFYLSTGRMPLDDYNDQPQRGNPHYKRSEIDELVAYVASLGGPAAPDADPARGNIAEGFQLYGEHCAGCHQIVGRGGLVVPAQVPNLQRSSPKQVAEAVRMGPYLMPRFTPKQIDQGQLDSIARYIAYTRHPRDEGGWAIGHIGPVPEGMVAWLLAGAALVLVARIIGERTTR